MVNGSGPAEDPSLSGALRAADLLSAGDARGALAAASEACHAGPDRAEAHYVYGQSWTALGEHGRAEQAFADALLLAPAWADAWVNYGIARYRRGAVGDAVTAMRQALLHAPDHAAATANLGAFLRVTGDPEGSEALLRAAVERNPADVGARMNLAADLMGEEDTEGALAALDGEAPAEPAAARHWHLQRFGALLRLDRVEEARAALAACDALGPVPPATLPLRLWRGVVMARRDRDAAGALAAADAMAEALDAMGPEGVPEHRIVGHYQLAAFHDRRGEPARAFAHWTAGHRLLATMQPFSRDRHRAYLDANRAHFGADRFAAGARASNRDGAPVFIVGMPRSGTTLCEQILAAHRDVHGAGERAALGQMFRALGGGRDEDAPARIAALGADALDQVAGRYLAELHELAPEAARVVDKMPGNLLHLGLAGLMLPGARVIHCTRDPRDIGLSIFSRRFHGWHDYAHDLADLGWTIREHGRLMEHWKAALPLPVLTVALTDWIADFDATLARVLAHLDLPHDPNCARFHESTAKVRTASRRQVREPINARGVGRWRHYQAELAPLIAALDPAAA